VSSVKHIRAPLADAMLQWLEEQASHGTFTTDGDLVIRSWNRWLATATGLPAARVIGQPLREVVPSLVERGLDSHYTDALAGQVKVLSQTLHRYLVPCQRPTGDYMGQTARIAPLILDGTIVGTVTVIEDVSERLVTESRLRAQIVAAENARAQAEEASRAKDDFLATLSHEIRTPLSAVLGWIHLLKAREPDTATVKRAVEVIERNAKSQLTLISDMLDMARLSSGKLRIEMTAVDMASVATSAIDAVRPAADAKNIRLVADLPTGVSIVSGDPDRLLQITWNIVSNAVKFTGEGGLVVISLRSDAAGAHLSVADTGAGIEERFLSQVFDRFKQADTSAKRHYGGLGLGLALVKDLVAMHGGRVEAASPGPGLGSTFTVHLPNRPAGVAAPVTRPVQQETETTLKGIHVLVVEDDSDAREIAQRSIIDAGGSVTAVATATAALAALASSSTRLDVLVSDIGLPGTDGYSLLTAVRELPRERGGNIPAVAVTAYASAADAQRALDCGFIAHITKPYVPHTLVAALRDAVQGRL
jgi:PAS domain S-box-containing protein